MDFRCFLLEGDTVERFLDGWQYKIKKVYASSIVCDFYDCVEDKHNLCTLRESDFRLVNRALDSRYSSY